MCSMNSKAIILALQFLQIFVFDLGLSGDCRAFVCDNYYCI